MKTHHQLLLTTIWPTTILPLGLQGMTGVSATGQCWLANVYDSQDVVRASPVLHNTRSVHPIYVHEHHRWVICSAVSPHRGIRHCAWSACCGAYIPLGHTTHASTVVVSDATTRIQLVVHKSFCNVYIPIYYSFVQRCRDVRQNMCFYMHMCEKKFTYAVIW